MGNQGMTNWKFSAFFAITLMLIAGVFSTTAMAADGDGYATVTSIGGTGVDSTTADNYRIHAGATTTIIITYTADTALQASLAGGSIRVNIPAGWRGGTGNTVGATGGILASSTTLPTGKDAPPVYVTIPSTFADVVVTLTNIKAPKVDALPDGPRDRSDQHKLYEFTTSSRTISGNYRTLAVDTTRTKRSEVQPTVKVGNIVGDTGKLTIAVTDRDAGITGSEAFETYPGYPNNNGEQARQFNIDYIAAGPMWQSWVYVEFPEELDALSDDEIDDLATPSGSLSPSGIAGRIVVKNLNGAEVRLFEDYTFASGASPPLINVNAGVNDNSGDAATATNGEIQVLKLWVVKMDKGEGFRITYYSKIPSVGTTPGTFAVASQTSNAAASGGVYQRAIVDHIAPNVYAPSVTTVNEAIGTPTAPLSAGTVAGGGLRQKAGSGTMTISPGHVVVNAAKKVQDFTLTYKAQTRLRNTMLSTIVPLELLDTELQAVDLATSGNTDGRRSQDPGYVGYGGGNPATSDYRLRITDPNGATAPTSYGDTTREIQWHDFDIEGGKEFKTTIKVSIVGTVVPTTGTTPGAIQDDSQDLSSVNAGFLSTRDAADDGVYPFYTSVVAGALPVASEAKLYAARTNASDVVFTALADGYGVTDANTAGASQEVTTLRYHAASEVVVALRFEAEHTAVKDGKLYVDIPPGWSPPKAPDYAKLGKLDKDGSDAASIDETNEQSGDQPEGAVIVQVGPSTISDVANFLNAATANANYKVPLGKDRKTNKIILSTGKITIDNAQLAKGEVMLIRYKTKVQHNAGRADFDARFKASPSPGERDAGTVEVWIDNVEDGTGTATIRVDAPTVTVANTVRSGSEDNTVTVTFTAIGTMDGGQVSLELLPDPGAATGATPTWGAMQETDAKALNYVTITARGGTLNPHSVGRYFVAANLKHFDKGDTVTFTYGAGPNSAAVAPDVLGVGGVVVKSAGGTTGRATASQLKPLTGDKKPADKSDLDLVQHGKIYWEDKNSNKVPDRTTVAATNEVDGKFRINVISGADGSGTVAYEVGYSSNRADDGLYHVHAGDDQVYLRFTYTAKQRIVDGELKLTIPWTTAPQLLDQNYDGYTYVDSQTATSIGTTNISGHSVTLEIIEMNKGETFTIHYGVVGAGLGTVSPPASTDGSQNTFSIFPVYVRGSSVAEGGLSKSITSPPRIPIRAAASGVGTAIIDPAEVTAGSMDQTLTITYQATDSYTDTSTAAKVNRDYTVVNGELKLTVPKDWAPTPTDAPTTWWSTAAAGAFTTSTGTIDLTTKERVAVVTGINLNVGEMLTLTYTTANVTSDKTGDHQFKVAFKGDSNNKQRKDAQDVVVMDAQGNIVWDPDFKDLASQAALKVKVNEASADSGMVAVSQTTPAAIRAGSKTNELVFTYTAVGTITAPGQFSVKVPEGWNPPSNGTTVADANRYTVTHINKDGTTLLGNFASVVRSAPLTGGYMLADMTPGGKILTGEQVIFTYSNVEAPVKPGPYMFDVYSRNDASTDTWTQVGGEDGGVEVLVLSSEEASMVKVSVEEKLKATGAAIPVTVNLLAADGVTAATRDMALVVALSSDATGGEFSADMGSTATFTSTLDLNFNSGDNEMMAYYRDASAAVATITATPAAASGIPVDTAGVDTEVIKITSVSFTVNGETGMYAKADDVVTVTVEATPKRTTPPAVKIGSVATLTATEKADMLGTYTVPWTVVVDRHEGTHAVTATLAGVADPVAAKTELTVDTAAPTVEITAPAADMTVKNEATVDITATVTDGTKSSGISTVTADAKAVDTAQTAAIALSMSNGAYSGSFTISAANTTADGSRAIEVTAMDNAGNSSTKTVMVTLDNTKPVISSPEVDMMNVKSGDTLEVSAMVMGADTVSADVSALNAEVASVDLMDADADGKYTGSVMVTATDNGKKTITITATDAAASSMETVMVTLDNIAPEVTAVTPDPMDAKNGATVTISATVSGASTVTADVSMLDTMQTEMVMLTDDDGDGIYTGSHMISEDNTAADGDKTITVTATDAAGNEGMDTTTVALDNTVPEVTGVTVTPSPTRNEREVTISATVSEADATVSADVSDLDTMQTEMVMLTDADGDLTYTGKHMISKDNGAENGKRTITVTAADAAGNRGTEDGTVDLINTIDYTSTIPQGISLFHVPIDVTKIDDSPATLSMVSDLYDALGDAVNYLITYDGTNWNSYLGGSSGDAAITADLGIVAVMSSEKTIKFTGNAWGEGASMINLRDGLNLVGLPVNDPRVTNITDISKLPAFAGNISSIIVSSEGDFVMAASADGPVMGDAAYLITATAASETVSGEGWSNGEMAGAAPIALLGHKVDNQTAALFVEGSIVDELTGLAKEGFRIKVKNLSTKAALNTVSQSDVAENGYSMTFVDTKAGNAARIGDVLEISADSPNPLIGVQPVRHIVTADDVKDSRIKLETLIAYEIPAETELLRNYPNPFNPETWIPYHLSEDANVRLTIYDVNGEVVRTIDMGHQIAAKYETRSKAIYWDGRNRFGEQVASGIYFYSLNAGDFSATRKMVILK